MMTSGCSNINDFSIAEVALTYPNALTILTRHNIDFCCSGKQTFREACNKVGLNSDTIGSEIVHGKSHCDINVLRLNTWSVPLLIDYIIQNHHAYIYEAVPQLQELLDKVCDVHGEDHIELTEIRDDFGDLAAELIAHMEKEENVLFSALKALHEGAVTSSIRLEGPIAIMENEHEHAGDLTKSIRQLTHHYTVPRDACPTFALLFKKLEEFDHDLMQHIHIENNVLFKKVKGD